MRKIYGLEQIWVIRQVRNNIVIFEKEIKNIIPNEGEKAIVDTFYRNNGALYFSTETFYVGLYNGSIGESTILSTVPGEPVGHGYSRQAIERSEVGWPTIELDDNDWRVVSKTVSITAVGGSIGPVTGAFLCTSLDNTGVLTGAVAMSVSRTIPAGDKIEFVIRAKQK